MSLGRSFFWLSIGEFLFYISGYLVQAGAGRILGPQDYGKFALILTITILIANLIGNGIPIAMSKYISEFSKSDPGKIHDIKKKGALAQFIFMGAISFIFFACSYPLGNFLNDPSLIPLFQLSSLIIPCFAADSFYFYFFTGIQRFNFQSILKIIRAILRIIIILGLAYFFKLQGIIVGYIFVPLSIFLVALIADKFFFQYDHDKTEARSLFSIKQIIKYSIPITSFLIFYEILLSFDIYIIKYFYDDQATGFYNAALTIARIPSYLFYALTIILLPTVAQSYLINKEKVRKVVSQIFRYMLLIVFPVIALSVAYAKPVIIFFFGKNFESASIYIPPLITGAGFLAIFYVMAFAFNGAGKIKIPLYLTITALTLNVILDFILVPFWGISVIPIIKLLISLIVFPILLVLTKKVFDVSLQWKSLFKMTFSALTIYFIALFIPSGQIIFLFYSLLLFLLYLFILFALKEITRNDLKNILGMIKKPKKN